MHAVVSADVIKTAMKAMSALISEAKFHLKQEGIHSRAVDPANVGMIIVDIPRTAFETYTVEEEKTIGVSIDRILDILKATKKRDLVELKLNVDDSRMHVKFGSVEYSVALIDPTAIRKEPKIPELDLPAKVVLDAGELKKAIQATDKVGDHVLFRTDETGFYIEAEGDIDKITFHMGELELIEFNKAEAKSMFSLEYLKSFVKVASTGDIATIYLGTNYPLRLALDLADGRLKVEYLLAPRIEPELTE